MPNSTKTNADQDSSALAGNTGAPREMQTPDRVGQPGAAGEHRPGPNPRSPHPTGPNAPYELNDPDGLAAEKHR